MPRATRIDPATPPAERLGDSYPKASDDPPGGGGHLFSAGDQFAEESLLDLARAIDGAVRS